jgi:primosomal protein N' (replication factor Y) (superfamily II helicase)
MTAPGRIADVAFDAPLGHSFSYRVPDGWALRPGQRALAPLRGAARIGMVVAVRDGADAKLKPLDRLVDREPVFSPAQLELVHWISAQSLSSLGSTCAALLPPPSRSDADAPRESAVAEASQPEPAERKPELLVASGREKRLLDRIERAKGTAMLIAADVETSARWAQRLARIDRVVRLDSGVADDERAAAWHGLRDGSVRLATGTRSALLAPLRAPAVLALVDEHEAAQPSAYAFARRRARAGGPRAYFSVADRGHAERRGVVAR